MVVVRRVRRRYEYLNPIDKVGHVPIEGLRGGVIPGMHCIRTYYNWMNGVILFDRLLPSACSSHMLVSGVLRKLKLIQVPVYNDVVVVRFAQLLVP